MLIDYNRTNIEYSVGVMYLVILNLPRSIRFKWENVTLFGIIPGPCEPSLSVNSYLSLLISDLLDSWKGVQLKQPGTDTKAPFGCALPGVACDLSAAWKTCGFLSYTANLKCSRCYQNFSRWYPVRNCYDNFDRDNWEMHSNSCHHSDVKKILKCTTKTEWRVWPWLPLFKSTSFAILPPNWNAFDKPNAQSFFGNCKAFCKRLMDWKKYPWLHCPSQNCR